MLEYNSNILKSEEGIIYVDNLQVLQDTDKMYLHPNYLVLASFNYDMLKNYNYHSGTSYELFYVDNDSKLHQLTYYVNEGNGLYKTKDNNLRLNIDNKTIKENDNHELYIDNEELTCAYNDIYKGVLTGEDKLFYDHLLNNGGFIVASEGTLKLSNGLLMSLYEIKNYYDKFDKLSLEINKLAVKLDFEVDLFNLGDILYINKDGKYTKNPEGNMPFMICVIASNTLSDNCARFLPINFNNSKDIFARSNSNLYYKKLFNSLPVYKDDLNSLSSNSGITTSTYGYIATDNSEWKDNFKNIFNYTEHYYANFYTIKSNIIWYMDPDTFHDQDMYSIDKKAIVTEIINLDKFNLENYNGEITPIVEIEFSDGFKGYYLLKFVYNQTNARFELTEGSTTTIYPLMLLNKLNAQQESLSNISNTKNSKIKVYKSDLLINSTELINQYKIYSASIDSRILEYPWNKISDETYESYARRTGKITTSYSQVSLANPPFKFENENIDTIDYKILEKELRNKTNTITNTKTETKSRTVQDAITNTNTTVTYVEQVEKVNENELYYAEKVIGSDGSVEYIYKQREPKKTLVPVYNTSTTTTYVDRTEYYDEVTTEYSYQKVYTYKIIIEANITDRQRAYLKIQLGDSSTDLSDNLYLYFDNSTGIEYVFTQYQSTVSTGYMKITAYASSEYYDQNPIDLGIIAVNGYQGSFKCVYLSKAKHSFNFNLQNIIPIKGTIYKNYNILELAPEATILESNYYDDFLESYEYSLDLNYYTIDNSKVISSDYVHELLSSNTTEIVNGGKKKEIKESDKLPKEVIVKSNTVNERNNNNNIVVSSKYYNEYSGDTNPLIRYKKVDIIYKSNYTNEYYDNIKSTSNSVDEENIIIKSKKVDENTVVVKSNTVNEYDNNHKLIKDDDGNLVISSNNEDEATTNRHTVLFKKFKYRIAPGAIRIPFKYSRKNIIEFLKNRYKIYVDIRNAAGESTYDKFRFKKVEDYLVLDEEIPVYDINNINNVSIKGIEDDNGNLLTTKFRESGTLINKIIDWNELNTNK